MATPLRFPCPLCGKGMAVAETRANPSGLRRRRRCVDLTCKGKMTTQEIIVRVGTGRGTRRVLDGEHVLLPRTVWEDLTRLAKYALDSVLPSFDEEGGDGDVGDVRGQGDDS